MSLSNEEQLGISISNQCNFIKSVLADWAATQQGICIVGEHVTEKLLTGFNNVIGPKLIITFVSEEAYGSEDVQELLGMTRRYFDILIQRGKILSDPRNSALTTVTGPSRPFYDLVEECRDKLRCLEFPTPMVLNPPEYHGIRPLQSENWLLDSYVISISTLTQIGRPAFNPGALSNNDAGGAPFIQLDSTQAQFNQSY